MYKTIEASSTSMKQKTNMDTGDHFVCFRHLTHANVLLTKQMCFLNDFDQ